MSHRVPRLHSHMKEKADVLSTLFQSQIIVSSSFSVQFLNCDKCDQKVLTIALFA